MCLSLVRGLKRKLIREINGMRWVLCHTGSMMFAFATPEDWDFGLQDNKYGIKDHHILTLKDVNRRRGSWVLETTEITERYKDAQGIWMLNWRSLPVTLLQK